RRTGLVRPGGVADAGVDKMSRGTRRFTAASGDPASEALSDLRASVHIRIIRRSFHGSVHPVQRISPLRELTGIGAAGTQFGLGAAGLGESALRLGLHS